RGERFVITLDNFKEGSYSVHGGPPEAKIEVQFKAGAVSRITVLEDIGTTIVEIPAEEMADEPEPVRADVFQIGPVAADVPLKPETPPVQTPTSLVAQEELPASLMALPMVSDASGISPEDALKLLEPAPVDVVMEEGITIQPQRIPIQEISLVAQVQAPEKAEVPLQPAAAPLQGPEESLSVIVPSPKW